MLTQLKKTCFGVTRLLGVALCVGLLCVLESTYLLIKTLIFIYLSSLQS